MNTDTANTTEPVWGAPPAEPAHWSRNKTLAAVGIAAVLAGCGAAVIYAAAPGSSGQGFGGPGGGPGGWGQGGPGGQEGGGPGFGGAGFGGAGGQGATADSLHGEFVVSDGHGGYTTELTQTGKVTDISPTAVTARSDDGFTKTYLINTDTRQGRAPVQTGDTATIRAVTADGNTTATAITPQR
ncbi:MAG: hypothetical protein ABWY93_34555 [Mycobacterium sp.]